MRFQDFLIGDFTHKTWKRISNVLIFTLPVTLLLAWLFRPWWSNPDWNYIPFMKHISGLGKGRTEGNFGAWIFMLGFTFFPFIGLGWNGYIRRQLAAINQLYAWLVWAILQASMVCVAFVGIFDGRWPNPGLSRSLHGYGATYAFMGHTIFAVLVFLIISIYNYSLSPEDRDITQLWKFSLVIIQLVTIYLLFRIIGGAFLQWLFMLSLLGFTISMRAFFPNLSSKAINQ